MQRQPLQRSGQRARQRGITLVELMITVLMASLVVAGLNGIIGQTLEARRAVAERQDLMRQARFAMERMVRTVRYSQQLVLPLADNPATNWREHVREQTVPASPPEGDSTNATAVLALTLPLYSDLDFDGFPDADNDRDGRVDEDLGDDQNQDYGDGVYLIDDDGDGAVDETWGDTDDDEDGSDGEDAANGLDDDSDGHIDEDTRSDQNQDSCAGLCGIDDDGDGSIDEGSPDDDDEDGAVNEDWHDTVAFYLDNGTLKERLPVPWDETGVGGITGRDFLTFDLADNVTLLRFERLIGARYLLVDISIELTSASGQTASLSTRVRVGGAL